jgi:uncharacterized membrane protein SirB2
LTGGKFEGDHEAACTAARPRVADATTAVALVDSYPWIKPAHVGLVIASGMLFALRGAALIGGARWPMTRLPRVLSVAIDTALLGAGVALAVMLRLDPLATPWLATKLALLVLYIVLGSMALKRARSRGARVAWYCSALLCYGFMASVARTHDPLGVFAAALR